MGYIEFCLVMAIDMALGYIFATTIMLFVITRKRVMKRYLKWCAKIAEEVQTELLWTEE